jgi:hypothetical protein
VIGLVQAKASLWFRSCDTCKENTVRQHSWKEYIVLKVDFKVMERNNKKKYVL